LQLRNRPALVRNAFFVGFVQAGVEVKRLSAVNLAPTRDFEFGYNVGYITRS